jgi:hypothetical protein
VWSVYPNEGCYDTLVNWALVYPGQGGRYRAEGCMALGSDGSVVNDPTGELDRTPLYVGLPYTWGFVDGDRIFSLFSWEGSLTDCS